MMLRWKPIKTALPAFKDRAMSVSALTFLRDGSWTP
jgi:hypothetical protein